MNSSIREEVIARGYAFLRSYANGVNTIAVASELGQPITPWEGGLVQQLVPRGCAPPNTYSGIFGLKSFPFHSDLAHWRFPPRYLVLRCLKGYVDVPTLLIDGRTLVESEVMDILVRAIFKPRRPMSGSIRLLRLCENIEDGFCLRWDEVFLQPASKIGEIAKGLVRDYLARINPESIALVRPGDTLLIDNWRMLHARSQVAAEQHDRKLERVYLEKLH